MSISSIAPATFLFEDDGSIPNNPKLPLLFYAGVFNDVTPRLIEETFHANEWGNNWRASVFPFPHYHAEAHEALGCFIGSVTIRLGGAKGIEQKVQRGDVVVIPAGWAMRILRAPAILQWSALIRPAKTPTSNAESRANAPGH